MKLGRLGSALLLGLITAALVTIIEAIAYYLVTGVPVLGHILAPLILIFSVLLSITAFVFGVIAYYVATIMFKDSNVALYYAGLVAVLEFLISFDVISTIIAFISGYLSFKIAGAIKEINNDVGKRQSPAKTGA